MLPRRELNGLELEFLFVIGFNLSVTRQEYSAYEKQLLCHATTTAALPHPVAVVGPVCTIPVKDNWGHFEGAMDVDVEAEAGDGFDDCVAPSYDIYPQYAQPVSEPVHQPVHQPRPVPVHYPHQQHQMSSHLRCSPEAGSPFSPMRSWVTIPQQ